MGSALTYSRAVFDVADEAAARHVILTPEDSVGTDERWERETPYLADLIASQLGVGPGVFVDYGCGIGRLAKPLLERSDCHVIGVDLSERMRALAPGYVASQRFSAVSPHAFQAMIASGLRIAGAFSVWALQHSLSPEPEIALLSHAIRPGGKLLVVNLHRRAVPTAEGLWADDGIDVRALASRYFTHAEFGALDPNAVSETTRARSWWGVFSR